MDKLLQNIKNNGFPKIWVSNLNDGTSRNPIIYVDYSDQDVIRVGENIC